MKKIFKLLTVVLTVAILIGTFAGCHKKDETAFTIGNHKYTSAMYSCVLYNAASAVRSKINTSVSESGGDTSKIKYETYKFNDEGNVDPAGTVSYEAIIEKEALNRLLTFSVLQDKMAAESLTLPENYRQSAEVEAYYYWYAGCSYSTYMQYGNQVSSYYTPYSTLLEPNGVLYNTYEQFMVFETTYNYYFEHLYGEGGTSEVKADVIKDHINTHYAIADTIEFSKKAAADATLTDEQLQALKAKADAYAERINKGEEFSVIYEEYEAEQAEEDGTTSSSASTSSNADSSATDSSDSSSAASSETTGSGETEFTPEQYTLIYGDEDAGYDDKYFKTLHDSAVGKAIVIDDDVSSSYKLLVRRDILEEEYYYNNMRSSILYDLKQEEFDDMLIKDASALTVKENTHATKPFRVKDIKFK